MANCFYPEQKSEVKRYVVSSSSSSSRPVGCPPRHSNGRASRRHRVQDGERRLRRRARAVPWGGIARWGTNIYDAGLPGQGSKTTLLSRMPHHRRNQNEWVRELEESEQTAEDILEEEGGGEEEDASGGGSAACAGHRPTKRDHLDRRGDPASRGEECAGTSGTDRSSGTGTGSTKFPTPCGAQRLQGGQRSARRCQPIEEIARGTGVPVRNPRGGSGTGAPDGSTEGVRSRLPEPRANLLPRCVHTGHTKYSLVARRYRRSKREVEG